MIRVLSFQRGTYLPSSLEIMEEGCLELPLRSCRRGHIMEQDRDDNHSAGTGLGAPGCSAERKGRGHEGVGVFTSHGL